VRRRIHRRLAGKFGWNLDHRLVDEHRHWVQIARIAFQTEALCFERQCAAAGEWVVEGRELFRVE
jgi:hypothetical protein